MVISTTFIEKKKPSAESWMNGAIIGLKWILKILFADLNVCSWNCQSVPIILVFFMSRQVK